MNALLIVDVQNDFCPGGALPVPEGDQVVPVINELSAKFDHVIQTQDWHPAGHRSFASSHDGKEPMDEIEMDYGMQTLWPDHCVQGTAGADFHPDLTTTRTEMVIRKGFRPEIDSYSAFFENDNETPTGLTGYLRERDIDTLFIVGLAADFCVKWSALDGSKQGFGVYVVEDATRGIDANGSLAAAWDEMNAAGVQIISSDAAKTLA
ncbi:nicotinamidase/pyrazinamidase [Longibacter salinarum]|uniref:Nicotinamidase n=1 Tax=Longibacter salinarum TaxID=1850348 RepID=A0A2A8D1U4_9BACT|nr:bifunctional nicotinamidase/pyrazinamidase [Longibacter salinarum]PEN14777.1 nicotinamidase/pyrazinamidase [Longibacter salinarum]